MTLHDKVYCPDCGYEWYPRGHSMPLKCHNCGNPDLHTLEPFDWANTWIGHIVGLLFLSGLCSAIPVIGYPLGMFLMFCLLGYIVYTIWRFLNWLFTPIKWIVKDITSHTPSTPRVKSPRKRRIKKSHVEIYDPRYYAMLQRVNHRRILEERQRRAKTGEDLRRRALFTILWSTNWWTNKWLSNQTNTML